MVALASPNSCLSAAAQACRNDSTRTPSASASSFRMLAASGLSLSPSDRTVCLPFLMVRRYQTPGRSFTEYLRPSVTPSAIECSQCGLCCTSKPERACGVLSFAELNLAMCIPVQFATTLPVRQWYRAIRYGLRKLRASSISYLVSLDARLMALYAKIALDGGIW